MPKEIYDACCNDCAGFFISSEIVSASSTHLPTPATCRRFAEARHVLEEALHLGALLEEAQLAKRICLNATGEKPGLNMKPSLCGRTGGALRRPISTF